MRAWILAGAVLLGSIAPAICHVTCALQSPTATTAAAEPSCHETERDTGGPALVALPCRHADRDALNARATAIFQLPAVALIPFDLGSSNVGAIELFVVAPAVSPSPPPLLIPLRI